MWAIGTDVAKDHLHNRLKLIEGGGAQHFGTFLTAEWFEQYVAERPILKRKPGGGYRRAWEKAHPGDRNEALDLSVYNLAMAHHLGLHKWAALDWLQLRTRLVPAVVALPAPAVLPDAALAPVPAPPASVPPAAPVGRRILSRGV